MTFNKFFKDVTGYDPYPWQNRLAEIPFWDWKSTAELPTSVGKSSLILIWAYKYYILKENNIPSKVAVIVNRRSLVSQIYNDYAKWFKNLEGFNHNIIKLHGGDNQTKKQDKKSFIYGKSIIIGTLDLLGSSIFFSSYLFSEKTQDIAGGYFLRNTFFILDEVQINPSIFEMLEINNNSKYRKVIAISATLPFKRDDTFKLTENDYNDERLSKKLQVKKTLQLFSCEDTNSFIQKIIEISSAFTTINNLIIVNRPDTAMKLQKELKDSILFTGRIRHKEKKSIEGKIISGEFKCKYLIATQTAELGIDFKNISNSIIIETCDFSSLTQRIGRTGRHSLEDVNIYCIINKEDVGNKIYGNSYHKTYEYINENNINDFSLLNIDKNILPKIEDRVDSFNLNKKILNVAPNIKDFITRKKIINEFLHPNENNLNAYLCWRNYKNIEEDEKYFEKYPIQDEELVSVPFYEIKKFLNEKNFYYKNFNEYCYGSSEDIFPEVIAIVDCSVGGLNKEGHFDINSTEMVMEILTKNTFKKSKNNRKKNSPMKIEEIRHEVKSLYYLSDLEGIRKYIPSIIINHHGRPRPTSKDLILHKTEIDNLPSQLLFDNTIYKKKIFPNLGSLEKNLDIEDLYYYGSLLRIADHIASRDNNCKTLYDHTNMVIECLKNIFSYEILNDDEKNMLIESAKLHDFGKASPEFQLKLKRNLKINNEKFKNNSIRDEILRQREYKFDVKQILAKS